MKLSKAQHEAKGLDLINRMIDIKAKGSPPHLVDAIMPEFQAWQAAGEQLKARDTAKRSNEFAKKMFGAGDAAPVVRQTREPFIPDTAVKALWHAAQSKQSLRLDSKDFKSSSEVKAGPFGTGNFTSGGLPSILDPSLQLGMPYEPDRAFSHFRQMPAPEGPSVEFIQHTSNTNPAAAVAELGLKPDLGPVFTTQTSSFTKIAGLASISTEALQDYSHFATWLPLELQRAVYDAENNEVINGSGTSPHMRGLLNVSGTLTRSMGSDTPLDALRKAVNDLRIGSSFATANLIIVHPTTWADLQMQKSTQGVYLLSPDGDTDSLSTLSNLWGIPVVSTTAIAAGTAIVLDAGTVLAWTRQAITVEVNQFGGDSSTASYWQSNVVGFRAEERVTIGATRPTAINIVTGLPA